MLGNTVVYIIEKNVICVVPDNMRRILLHLNNNYILT